MMTASMSSPSPQTSDYSNIRTAKRVTTKDGEKQAIWIPMLNNASRGKELAEKQLIVLGGTPEQQRELIETLSPEVVQPRYRNDRRKVKVVPISNRYALGYTYQDVLDVDQEDTLARLNIYMLSNPSSHFVPLLKPLFKTGTVQDTLITILLDWSDPFKWPRQLRQWTRILKSVVSSLDEETKIEMEEVMAAWKEKRVGQDTPNSLPGGQSSGSRHAPTTALGPGEWDEGLGVPLSVVCVHAEKIERLEREYGWQEDQFDFLLQWMRCVLLKHGASLIYTTNFDPNGLRTLIHSTLGIQSLLKKEIPKPNVIDRDKILVPPNWDSWGKIRILKEGFDIEFVADAWSVEIQSAPETTPMFQPAKSDDASPLRQTDDQATSAVAIFEAALQDPSLSGATYSNPLNLGEDAIAPPPSTETFLTQQAAILEQLKADDERARRGDNYPLRPGGVAMGSEADDGKASANARVAEHIGPYQINVGGVQVDPEEAMRRMRERDLERATAVSSNPASGGGREARGSSTPRRDRFAVSSGAASGADTPEGGAPKTNQELAGFFQSLIKKGPKAGAGSGSVSPTRGSPAPER